MNLYQMIPLICSVIASYQSSVKNNSQKHRTGSMALHRGVRANSQERRRESMTSHLHIGDNSQKHSFGTMVMGDSSVGENSDKYLTCSDQFTEHLNKCMETFTPNVHTYITTKPKNPFVHDIFVQHVCRNYKKMLLCIHVVLTNCKTVENTEKVQHKLGHRWVIQINKICHIKSKKPQTSTTANFDKMSFKFSTIHNEEENTIHKQQRKESYKINRNLTNSDLFNKLMHSSDTEGEIITMFVFRSALKATKQTGSMPNSLNGADKQKVYSGQKNKSLILLQLLISVCGTSNKEENYVRHQFLAQNENSTDKNGSTRIFCWQVVVLITLTNYLYSQITYIS